MQSTSRLLYEYQELQTRGIGRGSHEEYRPYLSVVRSKSHARRTMMCLPTCGNRIMHLLSDSEVSAALLFDWNPDVIDIREQYPLDPNRTLHIAKSLGFPHPGHTRGGAIMSTDFLVTFRKPGGGVVHRAFQVKDRMAAVSESLNTMRKLEIEKRYWAELHIVWRLIVAEQFPRVRLRNLKFLAPYRRKLITAESQEAFVRAVAPVLDSDEQVPISTLAPNLDPRVLDALKMLCAHRLTDFPVDTKDFLNCLPSDFSLRLDHARSK